MGRFIETLGGRYITGEDVGTYVADVHEMRKFTKHAGGEMAGHPYGGDPSAVTALGVLAGMKGALHATFGSNALEVRKESDADERDCRPHGGGRVLEEGLDSPYVIHNPALPACADMRVFIFMIFCENCPADVCPFVYI